jgi:hypothetical protein
MIASNETQRRTQRVLTATLRDVSFATAAELQQTIERRWRCSAEIDVLDRNDMYGYFAVRIDQGSEVFFIMAKRIAPWLPFRIVKVETENAAGWLRFTRWRPRLQRRGAGR